MKRNISTAHILLLLPLINYIALLGMYGEIDTSSIISLPTTTQGLGFSYYLGDKYYGETANTLKMIELKQFNPDNTSCHNKLRKAIIDLCCENSNIPDTLKLISLMIKHFRAQESPLNLKHLNLEIASFCNIHKFLSKEKETKQESLKVTIKEQDKNFIIKYNEEVKNFKQLYLDATEKLKKMRIDYIVNRHQQIHQTGQEIKEIKNGLVALHQLNQKQTTFRPKNKNNFDDEDCSDTETNSGEVEISYADENLKAKIKIDTLTKLTNQLTSEQIAQIEQIFASLNKIQPINTQHI